MSNQRRNRLILGVSAVIILDFLVILALLFPLSKKQTQDILSPAPVQMAAAVPLSEAQPVTAAEPDDPVSEEEEPAAVKEKSKPKGERTATEILADTNIIAHGMGTIGGLRTPNCLEGFLAQYKAGVRVFEADLRLSRDGKVVLRHDWWPANWQEGISWVHIPTREEFLSKKIQGEYTPLSFRDLLLLMRMYPDICIVTDTKFTESDVFSIQFDAMLADAHELGLTYLFDRIAVQVYSGNMHTALDNIYPFPHYIYTLYQDVEAPFQGTAEDFRTKAAYCKAHGIEGITMVDSLWNPAYAAIADEYGITVYVHTVNDAEEAEALLASGVDAVYSDSLTPGDLGEKETVQPEGGTVPITWFFKWFFKC